MTRQLAAFFLMAACGVPSETSLDAGATAVDRADPPPVCANLYPAVHHSGTIGAAATWGGNRIHYVDTDLFVQAHVTVGGCAKIEVAPGKTIELDTNGTLQPPAGDTTPSGIVFQPLSSPWARVRIKDGSFLLNGATIAGAGLMAPGAVTLETGTLSFQGLTITGSTGLGLAVTGGTIAPTSSGLVITGSSSSAAQVPANQLGSLPVGSYTGNAHDEILSPTNTTVSTSQTWHNLGVPYHFTGAGYVKVAGTSSVAQLTIEPGATLAFDKLAGMEIDPALGKTGAASAALFAVGLSNQQIVFTSAATLPGAPTGPLPGDWQGIYFGGAINLQLTQLQQVHIDYAGGPGGGALASCPTPYDSHFADNAAIRFLDGPMPSASFVNYTTINHSAANGIDRSFALVMGQTPSMVPSFTANNAFNDVPQCQQTHTRAYGNGCPSTPQCN